jgi:glycosyltransferase involved in cell wall biosynthesis
VIHICIPAHNEERTVGLLLWKIRKVMAEFGRKYRIMVLDDGSSDGTRAVLERYRRVLPLTVLNHQTRQGYAASLERLIRDTVDHSAYPKRDAIVTLQADFTESPDQMVPLIKAFEGGADLVAGRVEAEEGTPPRPVRLVRWLAPILVSRRFRDTPISDPVCGFRAYRVVVLKKALREAGQGRLLSQEGWAANVELAAKVAPHARQIAEVGLQVRNTVRQRKSRLRALSTLRHLIRVRDHASHLTRKERAA